MFFSSGIAVKLVIPACFKRESREFGTGPPTNAFGGDVSDDPFVIHLGTSLATNPSNPGYVFRSVSASTHGSISLTVFLSLLLRLYADAIRNKRVDEPILLGKPVYRIVLVFPTSL
jgi:hypothetical protein